MTDRSPPAHTADKPRRALVKRVFWTLLGGGFLVRFLLPSGNRAGDALRVAAAEIPDHGALVYRQARVALLREGGEVVALSLVCTHLGCTLSVSGEALTCPCHGSVFDRSGVPLEGPATRPLERLPVVARGAFVEVRV